MTTTERKNFLGIPVTGDIQQVDKRAAQRPIEDLQPLIRAVLDDPEIVEFGWRQYTPYFNDGDPCVFSAMEPWFRLTTDPDDGDFDTYDHEIDQHPRLSTRRWVGGRHEDQVLSPEDAARRERCAALSSAIDGGEFENVLLEAFGDHAEITVRRDGISVDFYSHD